MTFQPLEGHPLHCEDCRKRWHEASPVERDAIRKSLFDQAMAIQRADPRFQALMAKLAEDD